MDVEIFATCVYFEHLLECFQFLFGCPGKITCNIKYGRHVFNRINFHYSAKFQTIPYIVKGCSKRITHARTHTHTQTHIHEQGCFH